VARGRHRRKGLPDYIGRPWARTVARKRGSRKRSRVVVVRRGVDGIGRAYTKTVRTLVPKRLRGFVT
jgi:hypothetical protein